MELEKDILSCLEILRQGGTMLYPTDTIWGIGCDATNADAVKKIFDLKQRPSVKSMIVLVADRGDINRYTSHADPFIAEYLDTVDRPTTVIYEGAIGFAENLVGDDGTIAIRIVQDDFCRHLIRRFRKPIISTSANISGSEPPANFSLISDEIKNAVDYVVQYRQQDLSKAKASALVRFNKSGELVILRN